MDSNGDENGSHHEEEIVIVGGGIGGLACALALHRVGMKAAVLEQSDILRAWGAGITLWNNAFSVLDVLGIGDKLRSMFTNLHTPHDLRTVERKTLLELLAGELPEGTIRYNSRVRGVKKSHSKPGITELELQDGSTYSAKVVIGFDGINSCVASWMGLPKPEPVGHVGIRGVAIYPEGHNFEEKIHLFVGKGCRTAYIPASPTKVSWMYIWNDSPQGTSGEQMSKAEAVQEALKQFPQTPVSSVINNTPDETSFFKHAIRHRLNTNPESLVNGSVTVAGDAAHPCTPTMGQGGCLALEDALILTRLLYGALKTPNSNQEMLRVQEHERIHRALLEFQLERYERINFISTRSYRIGRVLMQTGWTVVDFFRDRFLIPMMYNKNTFLTHTLFAVGTLPGQSA